MNLQDFFNKYNGKSLDRDNAYGAQCMDLYNQYQEEVIGIKPVGAQYAKDVWNNYSKDNFIRIENTLDFVPLAGDVAVWTSDLGHVSICTGKGDKSSFQSFDQNWDNKMYCRFVTHNYGGGFRGVLRPKYLKKYTEGMYQTLYVMKVRDGVWGRVKSKDELSQDGKVNSNDKGYYLAGTNFTALEIIYANDDSVWARGYSGYVCIRDKNQEYCKKM